MFASGFLENICSENFLQIVKAFVVEIIHAFAFSSERI